MSEITDHRTLPECRRLTPNGTIKVAYVEGEGAFKDVVITLEDFVESIKIYFNLV